MKKAYIYMTIFIFISFSLLGNEQASLLVNDFAESVLEQNLNNKELETKYVVVAKSLNDLSLDSNDSLYYIALSEYWLARMYQRFNDIDLVIKNFDLNLNKDYNEVLKLYSDVDKIVEHYEIALDSLKKYLKKNKDSRGYQLFADVQGQLVLLKSFTYMLMNGLKVGKSLEKSLKHNPNHIESLIMDAASNIYTPLQYGGEPFLGLEKSLKLLELPNLSRPDHFNLLCNIAYAELLLEDYQKADFWIKKALDIYDSNIYALGIKALAERGGV